MDTQHHQNTREKVVQKLEEAKLKQEGKEDLSSKQQVPITVSPASPTSASSSPSHDFSFTISVHSSSTTTKTTTSTTVPDKATKLPPPSFAIDLSPADDIFFHGHLLPLHLLSYLPVSPRSSTNSLDSFTLPIRELLDDQIPNKSNNCSTSNSNINNSNESNNKNIHHHHHQTDNNETNTRRSKPKPFSLFRWRKGSEVREGEDKENRKKKLKFDLSHVLKRYARMVRPLLFFRGKRENLQFHRQAYSFSGNLSSRNKQELTGRRGGFSAPASMRASPTNSGLLVATATLPPTTSDSTMEELQAAIQAAIAHCKNSIAAEEKIKC